MSNTTKNGANSQHQISTDKPNQSPPLSAEVLLDAKDKLLNRIDELKAVNLTLCFARDCEHSELPKSVEDTVLGIIEMLADDASKAIETLQVGGKL